MGKLEGSTDVFNMTGSSGGGSPGQRIFHPGFEMAVRGGGVGSRGSSSASAADEYATQTILNTTASSGAIRTTPPTTSTTTPTHRYPMSAPSRPISRVSSNISLSTMTSHPQPPPTTLVDIPDYLLRTAWADQHGVKEGDSIRAPSHLLPSKWNNFDKRNLLELTNGDMAVKFVGPGKGTDQDASTVRADCPMPTASDTGNEVGAVAGGGAGLYYWEVEVVSKGREGLIGVGFCHQSVCLNRLPGWESDSWGYHGDDGRSFCCQGSGKPYGPTFSAGDVIGCGVHFGKGTGFYTKNGVHLGTAFRDLNLRAPLFPAVGLRSMGECVEANFGNRPFVFDIKMYMHKEKLALMATIQSAILTSPLQSRPDDVHSVIQQLVASYLSHNTYIETARAFIQDVDLEEQSLMTPVKAVDASAKEDMDAVNRQIVRNAILTGDIDRAISITQTFYPMVLAQNEQTFFKLRCRKFVEMMRQCAEARPPSLNATTTTTMTTTNGGGDVAMAEDDAPHNKHYHDDLLAKALTYGQSLQEDYRHDSRPAVQSALQEAFSLLAYEDPKNSIVAHLLDESGRVGVSEEVNSAILGKQYIYSSHFG